jgi:dTDP-4-amino-4,6-dideoxygalactose transaminase
VQRFNPYDTVAALEERVAEYGGSKYAVAVDSCTNALLIALRYSKLNGCADRVEIPKRTYVGVAYAILNAGLKIDFRDDNWSGDYQITGTNVVDAARRFRKGMYKPGTLYCVSAHWGKILKIGRGGFILTDSLTAVEALKKMRFDGRTQGVPPAQDKFEWPGYHCYMLPEEAARGLMLMSYMPDNNPDIPWDDYADLSQHEIFRR